jgi:hypothetical protein
MKQLAEFAIRLDNDVNGNPRYYLSIVAFCDESGKMFRPKFCTKYRGKRYGAGWVFQSYNLESDLKEAVNV